VSSLGSVSESTSRLFSCATAAREVQQTHPMVILNSERAFLFTNYS